MRFWKYWLFIITLCLVLITTVNPVISQNSTNPSSTPSDKGISSITVSSWTPMEVQPCQFAPNELAVPAKINAISIDNKSAFIQFWCPRLNKFNDILVSNPSSLIFLQQFHAGDQVNLAYSPEKKLTNISIAFFPLNWLIVIFALFLSSVVCLSITWFLTQTSNVPGLKGLMIGEDGRFSNSKSQIVIWFFVLISTYVATTSLRVICSESVDFFGGIIIPPNLLLLSGISTLTFATAKVIMKNSNPAGTQEDLVSAAKTAAETANKASDAAATDATKIASDATATETEKRASEVAATDAAQIATEAAKIALDVEKEEKPDWKNFSRHLMNKKGTNSLDLGDFQMSIITLLTVSVYIGQFIGSLGIVTLSKNVSLPDVDSTLFATFGLAQATYLAKKFIDEGNG